MNKDFVDWVMQNKIPHRNESQDSPWHPMRKSRDNVGVVHPKVTGSTFISHATEEDYQPNGVDISLGHVFRIDKTQPFTLTADNKKEHHSKSRVAPDKDDFFMLSEGTYEFVALNEIKVAENECGYVIVRSTLNRNGIILSSGLYDSGYEGKMVGTLHVMVPYVRLQKGCRIGQYISFAAECHKQYDGSYGFGKEHDVKVYGNG